uniref:uncharacterized protein LOC109951666 n=1 Tax=Monopterus albus TaxID=43700 RepID=UPI0009B3FF5D|nr:uncharacterized protein LOC109951666 [Monopterus albus]
MEDNISFTGLEPLFIKEEDAETDRTHMEPRACNTAQSGLAFTGTQLNPSSLIKPYLQEMDDLLKSCEELTGIPFGSRYLESYTEKSMSESSHDPSKEKVTTESYRETSYLSTSYIDIHIDAADAEDHPAQSQAQGTGTIINRCEMATEESHLTKMPLTSAENKLSETMLEYEGQLLGMLAMLENCTEDAGVDFEPQNQATDISQEYVNITKNPHRCRGTTLVPVQQEKPVKLETQPMQLETCIAQHAEGDEASNNSRDVVTVDSVPKGSQQNPLLGCDNMGGFSVEMSGNFNADQRVFDQQFLFSRPSKPFDSKKNDPKDITGAEVDDTEMTAEERHELRLDTIYLRSGMNELGQLGSQMEDCIQEVQQLEKRRKELLLEVLELRGNKDREKAEGSKEEEEETAEQMDSKVAELINMLKKEEEGRREERKREIQSLREARAEEERRIWKINLERQWLQEQLRQLKKRLFTMARDCAHSQAAFNAQHCAVELLKREEEKLQSLVLQLTTEGCQLRLAQQQRLSGLEADLHAKCSSQASSTQEELTDCRRHSCGDIQQYVYGGLRALEDRYEPILLALLKRREATAGALVKAKEQAQELKAQLKPIKEEIQKLKLQRACSEEKIKLIHIHRREDAGQYKETVYCLEERSRELKTELKIQKKKNKEIEELKDSLTKQLLLYRAAVEDYNKCDHVKKT